MSAEHELVDVLLVRTSVFAAGCSNEACPWDADSWNQRPCDLPNQVGLAGKIPGTGSCGWGYGQSDEAFGLSDCNRSRDAMWRVYDLDDPPPIDEWSDDDHANAVWVKVPASLVDTLRLPAAALLEGNQG